MLNQIVTEPNIPLMTINLRDLKNEDNNNNLVDAIIAFQRTEQKFPPVSTGVSSNADTLVDTVQPSSFDNSGVTI